MEYFRDPKKKVKSLNGVSMGAPITPLLETYPEFKKNSSLVNKIITDLQNDGLLSTANMSTIMTSGGMLASRTTDLGNQFLDYISISS